MTAIKIDYSTRILRIAPLQEDLENYTNLTTIFDVTEVKHTRNLKGDFFVEFYGPAGIKGTITNVNWIVHAIEKKRT